MARKLSRCKCDQYSGAWAVMKHADYHPWTPRYLDSKDSTSVEYKIDSFSSVYRRLTGKDVVFEFPVQQQE